MSSREKLERALRSKTNLSADEIASIATADGWTLIYAASSNRRVDRVEICFTGFTASERDELEDIAAGAGMTVVQQVNKNLAYLCVGEKPGPAKVERAKELRKRVISADKFLVLVELGEL
ncbi:MAG: hypothetical protein EAZ30_06500 [Betaproteobacteria bacterium]|nr:MAG: hypothetical protein EAZ30_06500 [Betaproteobacteria bacterium]